MSTFNPQKMLVAEFDRPVYRGCHSPFTQLVRRYDDPKTPQFNRSRCAGWARFRFSVVGSLLSSPPARIPSTRHSRACREDLVASRDRA